MGWIETRNRADRDGKVHTLYRARHRVKGRVKSSEDFDKKGDAADWLKTIEGDKVKGAYRDPKLGRQTVEAWAEGWYKSTVDHRPSTRARNRSIIDAHVVPHWGTWKLSEVEQLDVQAWVGELTAAGLAPSSVRRVYATFSKLMRSAVTAGRISSSPCVEVRIPRSETEEMRFVTRPEIAKLAGATDQRFRALILLAGYCGPRFGELAGLRWGRIDFLRRTMLIVENVVDVGGHLVAGQPKTRNGRRTVTIPEPVFAELLDHLERNGPKRLAGESQDDYRQRIAGARVFTAPDGGDLSLNNWRRRFFATAVEGSGVGPLRVHDLRHTAVALWIDEGANILEVCRRAGHGSSTFTLDRYGHLFQDKDEALASRLAASYVAPAEVPAAVIEQLSATGRNTKRAPRRAPGEIAAVGRTA